jgi:DNA-binding phage protein
MLSPKGNPSMDNLAAIFGAVGSRLKVNGTELSHGDIYAYS